MADRVIGLDLGSSSVKAAQVLRTEDGSFVVEQLAARALPRRAVVDGHIEEAERGRVAHIIAKMFAEEKFTTKNVIFGLNSSASTFLKEVLVTPVPEEHQDSALPLMLSAGDASLSPSDNEISYTVVGTEETDAGPKMRVLVYRAASDYVRQVAEVIEAAGLNVVGADLNSLAVLRAIAVQNRPDRQMDAVVDIGANVMTLMLHHNGVPKMLTLDPDSAGDVATARVADALGVDEEDDDSIAEWQKINDTDAVGLVAQARNAYAESTSVRVANAFKTFVGRSEEFDSIAAVTLVGGGVLLAGLSQNLHRALGRNVPMSYAQMDPAFQSVDGTPIQRQEQASGGDYLVSIGLGSGVAL